VVDEVGMDELIEGVEVALVEELLEHPPCDLDVGL
jgi:hypothetical protein